MTKKDMANMAAAGTRRATLSVGLALFCLLQQGCYMFVEREGKYYASTKHLWRGGKGFDTAGDAMMLTGVVIPVVGWVTLIPAGAVATLAERCVVAPVFDTVLLPIDWLDNKLLQIDEANYQDMQCRLEFDLDATLADSASWEDEDNVRYLKRWLSGQCGKRSLSSGQVSAVLSILGRRLQGQSDVDWRKMDEYRGVVGAVYKMSCDRDALDALVKGLVAIKGTTKVPVWKIIPHEIPIGQAWRDDDRVKFDDEQLTVLRDADIMKQEIDRLLKRRQEKREREKAGGQATAPEQQPQDGEVVK